MKIKLELLFSPKCFLNYFLTKYSVDFQVVEKKKKNLLNYLRFILLNLITKYLFLFCKNVKKISLDNFELLFFNNCFNNSEI